MRQFIGILFLSGYHKVPQVHLMWESQSDCTIKYVVKTMNRTRFWQIKKFIHFSDNTNLDKSDKFAKIIPLINLMNEKLDFCGTIEDVYSIVQSMSRWCPTHLLRPTQADTQPKTIQFGYKNFWLTTKTGFPVHCIPYAGKKGICGQSGKDLTARVVLQLVLTGCISDKDFLFFDNWYAGYKILTILTALGIRTTGTIRTDRLKFLPSQFEGAQEK